MSPSPNGSGPTYDADHSPPPNRQFGFNSWASQTGKMEMADQENEQVVETAIEARGAELGPSVRNVLAWSLAFVVVAFAGVYFMFFRT